MRVREAQQDLELRTDVGSVRARVIPALVAAVLVTSAAAIGPGLGAALFVGGLWVALFAYLAFHLYRSGIVLTRDEIVVRGAFGQRRRSRALAAGVVRATVIPERGAPCDTLFVLDARGGPLIRLYCDNYAPEDVERLLGALGLPVQGPDHAVRPDELARTYPGLVSWVERHPYRFGFAVAGVLLLALLVTVTALVLVLE